MLSALTVSALLAATPTGRPPSAGTPPPASEPALRAAADPPRDTPLREDTRPPAPSVLDVPSTLDGAPPAYAPRTTVRAGVARPSAPTSPTVRVVSEVLVAGAAGTLVGGLGGYVGCIGSLSERNSCSDGTVAAGALTGFGLSVAAMVPLTGRYLDGRGSPVVSWFGEALGAGAAFAIAQGNSSRLLWFAPPLMLVGAVLGYELSYGPAPQRTGPGLVSVAPTLGPDGRAGLAVAGRF